MKSSRAHVFISGKVQGVFFRENTSNKASNLGLKGWVKNLPDGRVEAVFEGPEDKVKEMVSWCKVGPIGSLVESVETSEEEPRDEFTSFTVRY